MKLTKNGVTYDVMDEIQISAFRKSGYRPVSETEPEQGETLAPAVSEESTDYNDMDDEERIASLAAEHGVDITGKTIRQTKNALKKMGVDVDAY